MAYDLYSTEKVFSNELANILCNKVLDNVFATYPGSETKLVATNQLAKMLQGDPLTALPVIPFVTNDALIYGYLVQKLQQIITVQTQVAFQNRVQVVTSVAYFEFWFDDTFISAVNVNASGVYARNITELN
jgi:hypothetical protein